MEERDPVLEARLKEQFQGCGFGDTIHAFASCDSTMERAHALARDGAGEGTLVFAARQTQGRGRLGRRWESPDGGAYFSLILRPTRPPAEAPQLSLVAGLATAEAIYEQMIAMAAGTGSSDGGLVAAPGSSERSARPTEARSRSKIFLARPSPSLGTPWPLGKSTSASPGPLRPPKASPPAATPVVSIRWPNDILLDGKKVAGILTETSTHHYVVVGIGINVATDPKDLPDTATSLAASGAACDPYLLTAALCSKLDGWYVVWTAQGFAPIRAALRPWLNMGGVVRLTTGDSQVEGQATDVDNRGCLLVRLESGVVRTFEAGEVSLLR